MKLNPNAEEEISALQALYCKSNEFSCEQDPLTTNICVRVLMDMGQEDSSMDPIIVFTLPADYPNSSIESITVSARALKPALINQLQEEINEQCMVLEGEPMLMMTLCCRAQELLQTEYDKLKKLNLTFNNNQRENNTSQCTEDSKRGDNIGNKYSSHDVPAQLRTSENKANILLDLEQAKSKSDTDHFVTTLLHLDHMRSRQNYVKLIKRWVSELTLAGRLLFCGRFILLLLQGKQQDIKEYIVRNKTTNVDVDSRGRSCKERMLTVLYEGCEATVTRLTDFVVEEGPLGQQDLKERFYAFKMSSLYSDYVQQLR